MNRRKRLEAKKGKKRLSLLILLLAVSIGFALLSVTLKINGTANIKSNTWNIHWENVIPNEESTVTAETPTLSENDTKVSYEVELEMPGDFYEFTVDAVNSGSISGVIDDVIHTVKQVTVVNNEEVETTATLPEYILYTVYYDGTTTAPARGDILEEGDSQRYRVRIEYDRNSTTLASSNLKYRITDEFDYVQTKEAAPEPVIACSQLEANAIEDTGATGLIRVNHAATDNTAALADYRYTGANPNNYVYFNCGNVYKSSTCETWRIIGCTSDGNMKLIRDAAVDSRRWNMLDAPAGSESFNDWSTSGTKNYLNDDYYNNSLTDSAKRLIAEKEWYTSGPIGNGSSGLVGTPSEAFAAERSNNTVTTATGPAASPTSQPVTAKVGLMYASDFGYASSACHNTHKLANEYRDIDSSQDFYDKDSACTETNWLNKSLYEWTMTPTYRNNHASYVFQIVGGGVEETISWLRGVYVRPAVYTIKSATVIGEGTSASPYHLVSDGWFFENADDFDDTGEPLTSQKWRFYKKGVRVQNELLNASGDYTGSGGKKNTYLIKDGYAYFGWYERKDGNRYYFSTFDKNHNGLIEGNMLKNMTQVINNVEYKFDKDGKCTQNCEQAQNVLVEQ